MKRTLFLRQFFQCVLGFFLVYIVETAARVLLWVSLCCPPHSSFQSTDLSSFFHHRPVSTHTHTHTNAMSGCTIMMLPGLFPNVNNTLKTNGWMCRWMCWLRPACLSRSTCMLLNSFMVFGDVTLIRLSGQKSRSHMQVHRCASILVSAVSGVTRLLSVSLDTFYYCAMMLQTLFPVCPQVLSLLMRS